MSERQEVSVLAVCVDQAARACLDRKNTVIASSGRQAIDLLRMLRFDLMITGSHLPDMPLFPFVQRVRIAWPWQKWALLARDLTCEQEIAARTLGVLSILDQLPQPEMVLSMAGRLASAGQRVEGLAEVSFAETRGKAAG